MSGRLPHKSKRPSQHGFTLVEVIVTIVVMAIIATGLAVLTGSIVQGNQSSSKLTKATMLAQERIETFRITEYDDISSGSDAIEGFQITYTVTPDSPDPNMKDVQVVVTWESMTNDLQQITLYTIIDKRNP